MTAAEKAITPCMFYAYGSCRAKSCAFLHSDTNTYEGPPPRTLGKSGKATANVSAAVVIPEVVANSATTPAIPAMPFKASRTVPWLWDTAAGRHLIGRQAFTPAVKEHVQQSASPVAFATGGGSQPGQESLSFNGNKILDGEEVYVLEECPPALSIGKAVIDKGYMFISDPPESVPYLVAPENINRCRIKVPKNDKIRASRVVEYVPQYDEELSPCSFEPSETLAPVPNAMPAPSVEPKILAGTASPNSPDYSPSGSLPSIKDVKVDLVPELVDGAVGAADASEHQKFAVDFSSAPKHPKDSKLLVELGNGEPPIDQILKQQATNPKHMRTYSPNNLFYPISHIAKDTAMKVSHTKDGKAV